MVMLLPTRLSAVGATVRLLFASHPRAFVTSAVGSLIEPLFYPALLLILHQMLQGITGSAGTVQLTGTVVVSGIELIALLLIQRLRLIIRDVSSPILRQEAWQDCSTILILNNTSVPVSLSQYHTFEHT